MIRFVIRPDVNTGPAQVIVDDLPRYRSRVRHGDEGLAHDVLWIDHRLASRSEEHTSELQSHSDLVCRLLLEKKKYVATKSNQSQDVCRLDNSKGTTQD